MLETILLLLFVGLVVWLSLRIGQSASQKGRSFGAFFWVSLLLFPVGMLVMGIIAASLKRLPDSEVKAIEREFELSFLPKIVGGEMENAFYSNYKSAWKDYLARGSISEQDVENYEQWYKQTLEKMAASGHITSGELEVHMRGKKLGRANRKLAKFRKYSVGFGRRGKEMANQLDSELNEGDATPRFDTKPTSVDTADEESAKNLEFLNGIERLAALKKAGMLSDQEFVEAKKRLLG